MADGYRFAQSARNWRTAAIVGMIWLACLAAWAWMDAAWWILAFLVAFTLPTVSDLVTDPCSGLSLSDTHLRWWSGRRHVRLPISDIDHMRLDTRLDFTVRATAVLRTGRKLRLPFESTPPHRTFENALTAAGIPVKRFHFQLMQ